VSAKKARIPRTPKNDSVRKIPYCNPYWQFAGWRVERAERRLTCFFSDEDASQIALVLGSALAVSRRIRDAAKIPYAKISTSLKSTAVGHRGELVIGKWEQFSIAGMQGRVHRY